MISQSSGELSHTNFLTFGKGLYPGGTTVRRSCARLARICRSLSPSLGPDGLSKALGSTVCLFSSGMPNSLHAVRTGSATRISAQPSLSKCTFFFVDFLPRLRSALSTIPSLAMIDQNPSGSEFVLGGASSALCDCYASHS